MVKILRTFGDMHTGVGLIHMSPGQIPRSHERQFERMKEKALQPRSFFCAPLWGFAKLNRAKPRVKPR